MILAEKRNENLFQLLKNEFDLLETKSNSLERFGVDLSHRTQETDLIEDFREEKKFVQDVKVLLKDLIRKSVENESKWKIYSQKTMTYRENLNSFEEKLEEIRETIDRWTKIPMKNLDATSKKVSALLVERTTIERNGKICDELTENLEDSVENKSFFQNLSADLNKKQNDLFQRASTVEKKISKIFHRIDEINEVFSQLEEFHFQIERKFAQLNDFPLTSNVEQRQEKFLFVQVCRDFVVAPFIGENSFQMFLDDRRKSSTQRAERSTTSRTNRTSQTEHLRNSNTFRPHFREESNFNRTNQRKFHFLSAAQIKRRRKTLVSTDFLR